MKALEPIQINLSPIPRNVGTEDDVDLDTRLLKVRSRVSNHMKKALAKTHLAKFVSSKDVKAISIAAQTGSTNVGGSILVKKKDDSIETLDFSIDDRSHGKYNKPLDPNKELPRYTNNAEIEAGRLELNALYDLFAFVSEHAKKNIQAYQSHAGVDLNTLSNLENRGKAKAAVERHLGREVDFDSEHYIIRNNRNIAGVNSYVKGIFPERVPIHMAGMMAKVFPDNRKLSVRLPHAKNATEVFNAEAKPEFNLDILNDSEGPLNYATTQLPDDVDYTDRNAIHIIGGTGNNVTIGHKLQKKDGAWDFKEGTAVTEAGHDDTAMFDGGWDYEKFGKILEPFRQRHGIPGLSSYEDMVAGCPSEEVDRGLKGVLNYIKALDIKTKGAEPDESEFKSIVSFTDNAEAKLQAVADKLKIPLGDLKGSSLLTNPSVVKDSYDIQKAAEAGDKLAVKLSENWIYRTARLLGSRYKEELSNIAYISFTGSHIVRNMQKVAGLEDKFKEGLEAAGIEKFGDNGEQIIYIDTREAGNEDEKWDNTYFLAKKYLAVA